MFDLVDLMDLAKEFFVLTNNHGREYILIAYNNSVIIISMEIDMKAKTGLAQIDIKGIVDEINRFQSTLDCTELDIRRLKSKAVNIKDNVSIDNGFAILGMIACLEWDLESAKGYFERAVQQSGGSREHLYNYSRSLEFLRQSLPGYGWGPSTGLPR